MNSYLIHFAVYSFAMIGFIVIALYVYKKSMYSGLKSVNKDFLKVENALRLSASKTIYVLKAGNEKFLIAGDSANTTILAKLDNQNNEIKINNEKITDFSNIKRINRG